MLEFSLFIPLSAKMGALLNRFTFFVLVICFAAYDDRDKFPPKQRHHLCVMSFFCGKKKSAKFDIFVGCDILQKKEAKSMSKIVDSHNANICCQKLYSVWSSEKIATPIRREMKNSHLTIRALQLKIARNIDRQGIPKDSKIVPFAGKNETEIIKAMQQSYADRDLVLQVRKKKTSKEDIKKLRSGLENLQMNAGCDRDLYLTSYNAGYMLKTLEKKLYEKEEEMEEEPFGL